MCGIVGCFGNIDKKILLSMMNEISHRGPDGDGIFIDDNVGLGHKRLSIIDLEGGSQPMFSSDKRYVIVFNGELYNFQDLKVNLVKKGFKFKTNSDTEVVLNMYIQYGKDCLKYFNGMFAFSVYDCVGKSLFIARDRLGIKPVYYSNVGNKFIFASEIKSLLKYPELNKAIKESSIHEFFLRQYISAPDTIFENVFKLEQGHYIFLKEGTFEKQKYWELNYSPKFNSERKVIYHLRRILEDSVKRRLISDVPIGAFLSGGVDSSIIVSLMDKYIVDGLKTFSVGFEDSDYDETNYARLMSRKLNTDHKEIILGSDSIKYLDRCIYHLDEPLSDFASLPTYLLSKEARKKVKVVLTGEGGDENFGGYNYYNTFSTLNKIPFVSKNMIYRKKIFVYNRFNSFILKNSNNYIEKKLINGYFSKGNFKNQMLNWDTNIWLPDDLLMKVDKMTMANSLEARVPFLDHKFVEFTSFLHPKYKNGKHILKKAFSDFIPSKIINRKKHGFDVPVESWFNSCLRDKVDSVIDENKEFLSKYLDIKKVNVMMKNNRDNLFMWRLYNLSVWGRKFL